MSAQRRKLGDYELIERLGRGGMGEVWRARRVSMGTKKAFAIKLIRDGREHARVVSEDKERKHFVDEAKIGMLLTHPNIVSVFDIGEHDNTLFMAQEYIDGCSLRVFIAALEVLRRRDAIDLKLSVYICKQVLQALDYAHSLALEGVAQGIVHRDVSPSNVMLGLSGEVKLTDFGIARAASVDTTGKYIRGKLSYMPLEQLLGWESQVSDLFPVGAILYELVTGRQFREGKDPKRLQKVIQANERPRLNLPGAQQIEQLFTGLTQPDPAERFQRASEAIHLIQLWPGYEDCQTKLAALVRELRQKHVPTSGATVHDRPLAPPSHGRPAVRAGGGPPRREKDAPTSRFGDRKRSPAFPSPIQTATERVDDVETATAAPEPPSVRRQFTLLPRRGVAVWLKLGTAAFFIGGLIGGVVVLLIRMSRPDDAPVQELAAFVAEAAVPTFDAPPEPEVTPAPEPEVEPADELPAPEPEPAKAQPAEREPEPPKAEPEPPPAEKSPPPVKPARAKARGPPPPGKDKAEPARAKAEPAPAAAASPPKEPAAKATLHLRLRGYDTAYFKVGGRAVSAATRSIVVTAGRRLSVKWRLDASKPWRTASGITVDPGSERVLGLKGGKVRLYTLQEWRAVGG